MALEICAVGGYGEVGKNMTAVKVDDDVVILDMGLHLPNYIKYTEEDRDDVVKVSATALRRVEAIPDDTVIKDWKPNVRAILSTHAHLDHIGAMPYMAGKYNCPIIATPYTLEVLKAILKDEKLRLPNKFIALNPNARIKITDKITVEFIHTTHSIPQTVMIALHTPYGVLMYTNDFKFDKTPVLGRKFNAERLAKLGKQGVLLAICDTLYADHDVKTPSESVARQMLKDVLLGVDSKGKAVVVTTFASHIARLKSIVEMGERMGRKVVFMGRSLAKYTYAAEAINLVRFSDRVKICRYSNQTKRMLKKIEKDGPHKYLMVVTGHQGEPKATLSKMATKVLPFAFRKEDHVVFSSKVIPVEVNIEARRELDAKLKNLGVRIFKDIHVSGHAGREDIRDFLKFTCPKYIIPSHSEDRCEDAFLDLGEEMGWPQESRIKMHNGRRITVSGLGGLEHNNL